MVGIIDYGMGNLHSAKKAFERAGADVIVTDDPQVILSCARVVLPGVGAFPDAIKKLNSSGLGDCVREVIANNVPFLGICLGMQVLFTSSEEGGKNPGLDVLKGHVTLMDFDSALKVPHMGWNEVYSKRGCPILDGVDGRDFYFVHSYYVLDSAAVGGVTDYGESFISVAWDGGNVFGTQFHPEKSSESGIKLIENFLAI